MLKNRLNAFTWMFFLTLVFLLAVGAHGLTLQPGDANGDYAVNVSDAVWIINYVFISGDAPLDMHIADVNSDCTVNVSDAIRILNYVFNSDGDPLSNDCLHTETTGNCLGKGMVPDSDYVYIEVLGNDLHIHHMNAYEQCCLEYYVEYSLEGSTIIAQETDIGDECDCICYFDFLESALYDLENGQYTVIVLAIFGDTLAVEDIVVDEDYGLLTHSSTGCLKDDFDPEPPEIEYTYENGVLAMNHGNAWFNCGGKIMTAFEQSVDTIRFIEINISNQWAYCMCYFAVSANINGIAPGSYVAEVYAREPMDAPAELIERRELILP
ncbi:MAG: hypothetical protein GF310_11540 [candidate division Zixibacteria bacterium]|nr:hypothetical protein [candidate division Zixibacteria bacterium]